MKIENCEIMVLKLGDVKVTKGGESYFMLDFADDTGTVFSIMCKDISLLKRIEPFQKTVINLELTNNAKYGLSLKII